MLGPGLGLPGSSLAEAAASLGWRGGCLAGVWRSLALEVEGRSLLQEVGWGRMWGRPGDQIPRIYPAGSVRPRSSALPISSGTASHPVAHPV